MEGRRPSAVLQHRPLPSPIPRLSINPECVAWVPEIAAIRKHGIYAYTAIVGEHPSPGIQRFNKRAVRFTLPSDTVVRPSHFPLFIVNLVVPETDKHASACTDINCGICQVVESQDRSATDGPRRTPAFGRFSIERVVGGIEPIAISRMPCAAVAAIPSVRFGPVPTRKPCSIKAGGLAAIHNRDARAMMVEPSRMAQFVHE